MLERVREKVKSARKRERTRKKEREKKVQRYGVSLKKAQGIEILRI